MMKYRNLSLNEVQKLASQLARQTAKKPTIIGLIGNLGGGKTTFAKAFARTHGIKSLKSPTFVVTQRYPVASRYLYHLDFYRLDAMSQLEHLGLDEILESENIVLIEWVDKFPAVKQQCDILITFKVKPQNKRDVEIKFS